MRILITLCARYTKSFSLHKVIAQPVYNLMYYLRKGLLMISRDYTLNMIIPGMSYHEVPTPDNNSVLQLQALYRGWFVRKSISQCFSKFHHLGSDLGDESSLPNMEFIISLWDKNHMNNTGHKKVEDEPSVDLDEVKTAFKPHCIQACDTLSNDLLTVNVTEKSKIDQDLAPVSTDQLKGQLSDLIQEKLWLENAIMARIEYLTSC